MKNDRYEIGDETFVGVLAAMPTKPLGLWDINGGWAPWLIYEWGVDYNCTRMLKINETWLELYTKPHNQWYKFTKSDIWGNRQLLG